MPDASAMTSPPLQPDADAEPAWYVQAAGQVWGPYSPARVARFAAEGRVTPESLLGPQSDGPFHPAGRWRNLASLFRAATPPSSTPYHHQPAPVVDSEPAAPSAPWPAAISKPDRPRPSTSGASSRPLVVWADLASLGADAFQALLCRYGEVVAIRPTVWLVQARCDPAHLRNALSRRLTGADALMIVHAPLDHAAWFNLDTAAERRLRQLWGGGG
jgi:hypothetical protein